MQLLAFVFMLFGALCIAVGAIAWLPFISSDMRLDLAGVVVFVVGGSLFYLAGSWLDKKVPPAKTRSFVLKPGDTRFITAMLKRDRRIYLILGLALLAFDTVMLLVVSASAGTENEMAHPWIAMTLGFATMLLIAAVAVLFLYASFRLRNAATTRLYDVLTKTPHMVTGLTVYLIQHELAPGTLGRQILAEIHVESEKLKTGVTEEQCSLLKQYIQLHSPQAPYREIEQAVSAR
jgi:hypothetical protein